MARCWAPAPEDRASFPHLLSCLQDFYSALGKYIWKCHCHVHMSNAYKIKLFRSHKSQFCCVSKLYSSIHTLAIFSFHVSAVLNRKHCYLKELGTTNLKKYGKNNQQVPLLLMLKNKCDQELWTNRHTTIWLACIQNLQLAFLFSWTAWLITSPVGCVIPNIRNVYFFCLFILMECRVSC